MPVMVLRGNTTNLPLADESVDLIVTSPPYFSHRSYTDGGEHYHGQIGAEPTPREYLDSLIACTAEWKRVIKPTGSIFVNLGDTYSTWHTPENRGQLLARGHRAGRGENDAYHARPQDWEVQPKSLIGIPWQYALRARDELGLTLRRDIIWSKPNGLPESVSDRVRSSHEYIFHLVKQRVYYAALDGIREPHKPESFIRFQPHRAPPGRRPAHIYNSQPAQTLSMEHGLHPAGRLPGSVWNPWDEDTWTMAVQPLIGPQCRLVVNGRTMKWFRTWGEGATYMRAIAAPLLWQRRPSLRPEEQHYAAFPMELPRRIIQAWSPTGICTACGQPRQPVTEKNYIPAGGRSGNERYARMEQGHGDLLMGRFKPQEMKHGRANATVTITGYECGCPDTTAPTRPAVVLDPFGGTGTTALVASTMGRTGITVDYSHSYSRFARWRTSDPGERAKAMQVKKPAVAATPPPGYSQDTLFEVDA